MNTPKQDGLIKIAVFYDGNYFYKVSNYYSYYHERRARISVSGLHEFIRHRVSEYEHAQVDLCQIVDAHYFKGRISAQEANNHALYNDRVFDDILIKEGVATHYSLLKTSPEGKWQEKGIDVWLALEAFEQVYNKRFDVLVLITCDGDYVPLVRKLNTLGTRVMLLSWDFQYVNNKGDKKETRTSGDLLNVVNYPISMHEEIDSRTSKTSSEINNLFYKPAEPRPSDAKEQLTQIKTDDATDGKIFKGEILSVLEGYGFITPEDEGKENLFFYYGEVIEGEFKDLKSGDQVQYEIGKSTKGEDAAVRVKFLNRSTTIDF